MATFDSYFAEDKPAPGKAPSHWLERTLIVTLLTRLISQKKDLIQSRINVGSRAGSPADDRTSLGDWWGRHPE